MARAGELWDGQTDFSGGHNDRVSEVLIGPTEGFHQNTNLDVDGTVQKRAGALKQNAVSYGATAEFGMLFHFKPTGGTQRLLVAYDDELASWDGASLTSLLSGLSVNKIMLPVAFKSVCYLNNNADNPLVYWPGYTGAGSKVWRSGTPQPASNPAFSANITGSMTAGTIKVRVRYVSPIDDVFFGEPAPNDADGVSLTVTASGGVRITIPVFAGTDHRVAKRIIERTTVGGAIFYYDGIVADNTTTTYDITQSDTALLANEVMPEPGYRDVPPKLWPFADFGQRIVGFDPTVFGRMRWSEIDEFGILPEAFPAQNYLDLDIADANDEPRMILRFSTWLVVYCGKSAHLVYIDDAGNGEQHRLQGWEMGVPGPRAGLEMSFGNLVWTYKGPYIYNGGAPVPVGERIQGTLKQLDLSKLGEMYVVHRQDRQQVKFVMPGLDDSSKNGLAWLYHYPEANARPEGFPLRHGWTPHTGAIAKSGCVGRGTTGRDEEYSGDYAGFFYREDVGLLEEHQADGSIDGWMTTRWMDCRRPALVKDFVECWVIMGQDTADAITCSWEVDFGKGPSGSVVLAPDDTAGVWDEGLWDEMLWAGGGAQVLHARISADGVSAVGRFCRLKFRQTEAGKSFKIVAVYVRATVEGMYDDAPP